MKWGLRGSGSEPSPEWLEEAGRETRLSVPTLRFCFSRGLTTLDSIRALLESKLSDLPSPATLLGMEAAVALLVEARDSRVRVFGDYDVDGTCGSALLSTGLSKMGFSVDAVQPDRFRDGYGLNVAAVEQAVADGVKVLVTVDCGITSFDALDRAKNLGLPVIVVDHHRVSEEKGLPVAAAVIDPHQAGCTSGLQELCGTGLAFFVLLAVRAEGRARGWFREAPEPNLRRELDLVAIATACDQVPLLAVNRLLVRHGMRVLREGRRVGLSALLEAARVKKSDLGFSSLSFVLGPRINASGRLASASHAFRMLTTENEREGFRLAFELEQLNRDRGEIQEAIVKEAEGQIPTVLRSQSAVFCDSRWHEGVLGIVATRMVEKTGVSAVVLSVHEGLAKGSLRAARGKDVLAALHECRDLLAGFGGHRAAAGVRVPLQYLEAFRDRFDQAMNLQPVTAPSVEVDLELNLEELGLQVIEELEELGPFGVGHPEPVIGLRVQMEPLNRIKDQHLKLSVRGASSDSPMEGIWFRAPKEANWAPEEWLDCAVIPEVNRFRGSKRAVLRIKGVRGIA